VAIIDEKLVEDTKVAAICEKTTVSRSPFLGNALAYGAAAKPVRVIAETVGDRFKLSVSNAGDAIPAATLQRMFLPFARGTIRPDQQGLGLGLYIASEIARAHGGTLTVESRDAETTLTFRMPSGPVA
jgi:sigma-B regulation protein RsbU (phosphoserine phosphatase)